MSETRILKEIEEIYRDPPDFISAGPIDDKDIVIIKVEFFCWI